MVEFMVGFRVRVVFRLGLGLVSGSGYGLNYDWV